MSKRLDIAAVTFAFVWAVVFPIMTPDQPFDLTVFLAAADGNLRGFYYGPWILPLFEALHLVPFPTVHILANLISNAGILLAVRTFGGDRKLVFLTYPVVALMYYGQMDGVYLGGLALMSLAVKRENALLASLAWMLAMAKFYIGIPLGIGILWCYADRRLALRVIMLAALCWILTLILWPGWITALLHRMQTDPPNSGPSVDLWGIAGPLVLLLWLPLVKIKDFRLWVMTWALTVPYLHAYGFVILLTLPIGPIGWIATIPYLKGAFHARYLQIIPASIYFSTLLREVALVPMIVNHGLHALGKLR